MSDNVRSYGFIGALKTPLSTRDEIDALSDALYDTDSMLMVTSSGDLAYIDYNANVSHSTRHDIYIMLIGYNHGKGQNGPNDLIEAAAEHNLEVDPATIVPFDCIWYNGSDCPIWSLTKEDILKHLG